MPDETIDRDKEKKLFAANLERLMLLRGMLNSHVAAQAGVSRNLVGLYRRAEVYPSPATMAKLCVPLRCTVDDFRKPLYASNIARLMNASAISKDAVAAQLGIKIATVDGWLDGSDTPKQIDVVLLSVLFKCNKTDIMGLPDLIPLIRWAQRERIPVTRAQDLFDLGLLTGATRTTFCIMVPSNIRTPPRSKQLVSLTKQRPRWGISGWQNFARRLDAIMRKKNINSSDLAEAVGVDSGSVYRWRTGDRTPEEDKLPLIADFCGCAIGELLAQPHHEAAA